MQPRGHSVLLLLLRGCSSHAAVERCLTTPPSARPHPLPRPRPRPRPSALALLQHPPARAGGPGGHTNRPAEHLAVAAHAGAAAAGYRHAHAQHPHERLPGVPTHRPAGRPAVAAVVRGGRRGGRAGGGAAVTGVVWEFGKVGKLRAPLAAPVAFLPRRFVSGRQTFPPLPPCRFANSVIQNTVAYLRKQVTVHAHAWVCAALLCTVPCCFVGRCCAEPRGQQHLTPGPAEPDQPRLCACLPCCRAPLISAWPTTSTLWRS